MPIEETVSAIAELVQAGYVRHLGLSEALGALEVTLDADDLAAIEAAVPPGAAAGDRYQPAQMAHLDSEAPVAAHWKEGLT